MSFIKQNKARLLLFPAIAILILPSILALFRPGFFVTDDGSWMIMRLSAFHQALMDGQFPVRFLPRLNHEYGYPVTNFSYPGFLYISEIFHLLGFGFINSIKIVFGLSLVFSFVFSYFFLSKIFDKVSSLAGGFVYLYFPYHLFDIYSRGSVGEALTLSLLPAALWSIEKNYFIFASITTAMIIVSHNTLALFFVPLIFLYSLFKNGIKEVRKELLQAVLMSFLALGLSSFFWIPAVLELSFTRFDSVKISNYSEYFLDPSLIGGFSLAVLIISPILIFKQYRKMEPKIRFKLVFFFTISTVSIFMSSALSSFIWRIIPSELIQFPFRFLSVTMIGVSFLAAYVLSRFSGNSKLFLSFILTASVFYSSASYISPKEFTSHDDLYYSTNQATTTTHNEYLPSSASIIPSSRPVNKVETEAQVSRFTSKSNKLSFSTTSEASEKAKVNIQYFPGWTLKINGREEVINYNNELGVMEFDLPIGRNHVFLEFRETPMRKLANLITGISLSVLAIYSLNQFRLWRKKT